MTLKAKKTHIWIQQVFVPNLNLKLWSWTRKSNWELHSVSMLKTRSESIITSTEKEHQICKSIELENTYIEFTKSIFRSVMNICKENISSLSGLEQLYL